MSLRRRRPRGQVRDPIAAAPNVEWVLEEPRHLRRASCVVEAVSPVRAEVGEGCRLANTLRTARAELPRQQAEAATRRTQGLLNCHSCRSLTCVSDLWR
jgi:hypothetical protein